MTLSNGRTSAYQWDYGLAVVTADPDGTLVRIANEHGSKAFVVEAEDGLYKIPNVLLTTGRAVVLYHLGGVEGTSLYTTSEDVLPVSEAPKPDDYILTDDEIRTWKELDERLTDAEETIVQHPGEIADLTSAVSQNTDDIAQNASDIDALESSVNALETDVNALEGDVDALETAVNALESDVDALESGKISNPANKVTGGSLVWNGSAWVVQFPELGSLADVFVCEYGVTDYDVVDDAAASLLQVYVKTSDGCIPLTGNGSADHTFSYISHNTATGEDTVVSLICKPTGWVTETTTIGSGGGTDDYTDLSNKPQINSVTLSGNKSSSDLGLADAVHTHSEYLTEETDPTVPSWAKASTKPSYTASEVGAIADPNSKSNGQVLTWNGSAWVAQTPSGGAEEIFTITLDSNWIPTNSYADIKAAKDAGKLLVVTKGINVFTVSDADLDVSEGAISAFSSTGSQTTYVYLEYLDGDWTGNNSIVRFIRNPAQTSDGYVLTYDANTLQWVARAPSAGVTDYDDLTDKPSINNVTLSGNKTTSDLGISLTGLSDVFIATYNTTTIAELDAARTAGKKIFLGTSDGVLRPLCEYSWSPKIYSFISGEGDGETISIISCKETGNNTVWSNYRHSYLWANTLIGPPNDGEVLTYNSSSDTWMAMPLPESTAPYVITLDGSTGLPTDEINDVLNAYNNGKILAVTNGSDYWYGRYASDDASEFYLEATYASGVATSTITLTYDYTNDEWSASIDDWALVPTSRTVNGKALSSNISLTSSDVGAIANPSSKSTGQVLTWNGSAWVASAVPTEIYTITVNSSLNLVGITVDDLFDLIQAKKFLVLKKQGSNSVYLPVYIESEYGDYIDAYFASASFGSANPQQRYINLYYESGDWDNSEGTQGIVPTARTVNGKSLNSNITLDATDVGAIPAPSSPTSGQFLSWNGSAWVATSLPVWNGGVT